MVNEKEPTKLYKVRNGYAVTKGNQVIKEGNIELTDKEHTLQSWKVEPLGNFEPEIENTSPEEIVQEESKESNIDRSVKKGRTFNRVMKTPKG